MVIRLPEDLQRYIQAGVQGGWFKSEQDAITQAVRLLSQQKAWISGQSQPHSEQAFEQCLLQSGFLGSLLPSVLPREENGFQPIRIEGEPLSETVIRERR